MNVYRFLSRLLLGLVLVTVLGRQLPLLAADLQAAAEPAAVPRSGWATDCLQALAQHQLLPEGDGLPSPETPMTWAGLTTLLNQALPTTEVPYGWASAVETSLQLPSPINVLYGLPEHRYAPDGLVTKTEAVNAVAAKLALPYIPRATEILTTSLLDGDRIAPYGQEGVAAMLEAGLLVNYPEAQRLNGDRPITQGEAAALVCQAHPEEAVQSTLSPDWIARSLPLPTQPQPEAELRGVWLTNIDSEVLFSRENLAAGIQRLKALNINTLYPVVWNFGYPQFPSEAAAQILGRPQRLWPGENPGFEAAQGDRDMLQEIIELAHAEDMAVIPWFEFGFMAPADYALLEQHPDWFTQRLDGSREIQQGKETFTWMSPFHPRTRQLLLLLMDEVLSNYDVEGIQVDDHLGMPVDMGYDPYTVDLYRREHGGAAPPEDHKDPDWMRWRADKITDFMMQVRRLIDRRQPDAILSVSPNPYPFSYDRYLQDWPTWSGLGLLDEVIVQVYRSDVDRFVWELTKPATVAARQDTLLSIGLLSGLRGRPTDIELLTDQLEAVRDRGYGGVSYFFYETLWVPDTESAEAREAQFVESFSRPARRP